VVERCLEKNPEQRFQSASDLAFALAAFVGSGTFPALPADIQKRRRWHSLVPVNAAIAALIIVPTVLFFRRAPNRPSSNAVPEMRIETMLFHLTAEDHIRTSNEPGAADGDAGGGSFASEQELQELAVEWPMKRLVEI
jgi:hypothetical protein